MGKKLAIIFPGVGYNTDRPLLYYSRKILKKNGYEVINISYSGLEEFSINEASKDKYLQYVSKAGELVKKQLEDIDFSGIDKLIFVSKSIGTVIGAIYAKQKNIKPYHILLTPIDYTFQFIEGCDGSIFCGNEDKLVNYEGVKQFCKINAWDFYEFKGGNHSLETGDIELDIENVKRYATVFDSIVSDMDISIYDYEVVCQNQQIKSMAEYKGEVLLIVNTATGCGFTPQYTALEKLYNKYNKQGFEILDFPCNQFGHQAPGSDDEIHSFCTSQYDITFEQFSKICVNGEKQSKLYEYLKSRKGFKGFDLSKPEGVFLAHKLEKDNPDYELTSDIKWNFTKFLVNRKGQVIERYEPTTDIEKIENDLQQIMTN